VIGRGSTGEVWRGQLRDTGAPIAAKVLDAALTRDPEVVTRFIRERALLTKVAHPSVVTVRDLVVEGDTLAIITDLVDGPSLRAVLDELGTVRPSHAIELIEQILRGLEAVHSEGLVHRDLKPENVLVAQGQDGEADARIVDFGIAQLAYGASANARGEVIGSAEYIAPELLEGGAPSPAADIYAVGIVLYELLCGRTPFGSENVATVIRRQLDEPAGRPAGMPMELWTVLQPLLAKDPVRRPPTASDARALLIGVADSVRGLPPLPVAVEDDPVVLDGDETIITPRRRADVEGQSEQPIAPPPPRRRRWLIAVAAVVVAAVVTTMVVLAGGDNAAAESIRSAPEYWTDTPGHPVVHRSLKIDGDAIAVHLQIQKVPGNGYSAGELVPEEFRTEVTVRGKRKTVSATGLLPIPIEGQDAADIAVDYRVGLGGVPPSQATLQRYERARVKLLQSARTRPGADTLVGLEVGPAIQLRPFERVWLPVSGIWAGDKPTVSVADSLGAGWHWSSSDPSVANVERGAVGSKEPGRKPGSMYFDVTGHAAGHTVISTVVGGRRYEMNVKVAGGPRSGRVCEPGVATPGMLNLVGSGAEHHPVPGTLLRFEGAVSKVAPGEGLLPVTTSGICPGAHVEPVSSEEFLRYAAAVENSTSKG
jgi:Serine/threonine protein kinase